MMMVGKTARAVAGAPPFAWPQTDWRRWTLRVGIFGACLVSALVLTASRLEITRLRYELSKLDAQRQSLLSETGRLQVESSALGAPRRVEALAASLGLGYPDRGSVVVLDE